MAKLVASRKALFGPAQLRDVERAAVRILEEVGLHVADDARAELGRLGRKANAAGRYTIKAAETRRFLKRERESSGNRFSTDPLPASGTDRPVEVFVAQYPTSVHDLVTDEIVPFTHPRLVEMTKLLDVLSSRGVTTSPPGNPADVPPKLQPVLAYWTAATYSRQGRAPVDPKWFEAVAYVMEMAEALGHPVKHLPVYIFSPLSLSGESLKVVLAMKDRLKGVSVNGMPSPGGSAPIRVAEAFAMSAAETIGSAILVREVTGLPVWWQVNAYPLDLRELAMIFGSPESFLFHLMSVEVNAFFHGTGWHPGTANIHTNAKLPGAQACAEKMGVMAAGAMLGERHFGAAGTLSLDEVFSPEQLLYDLEMKDHVQRLVGGTDLGIDVERCLAEVKEGVAAENFAGLESTREAYRTLYWHPELFERDFLGAWKSRGSRTIREKARGRIHELIASHSYRLDPATQKAIDGILARATKALTD